jgi:hypothetical protein
MSLDFWMGAFIGTMLALGLILLVVGRANSNATKKAGDVVASNERAHDLLEERNQIGREFNHLALKMAVMLTKMKKR